MILINLHIKILQKVVILPINVLTILREWLAQFQAKESLIYQSVYNDILVELKERITNIKELKPIKLREILKKLKKNKYYEHIPHIINKLNGIPPPIMSEKRRELRRMFKNHTFHKYCLEQKKLFILFVCFT